MRVVISVLIARRDSWRAVRIASAVRESVASAAADSAGATAEAGDASATTGTVTSDLEAALRDVLAAGVGFVEAGAGVDSAVFFEVFLSAAMLFELTRVFEEAISNALGILTSILTCLNHNL